MTNRVSVAFNPKRFFKGITRNVLLLGFVSLFTDLSSQMVFPLLPLFLTSVLGAGASAVGIVEGAAESTASLLKVFSGYWSDKIRKRKPFVLAGYSLSGLTKPLFALAQAWPFILVVRVVERVGKGLRTAPRDAIIAESAREAVRGKAYGFQRALDGIGSMLGALCAFLLLPLLGFRNLFLLAFLPGIAAVFTILFIREKKETQTRLLEQDSLRVNLAKLPLQLRLLILAAAIFSLGHFGYAFLLLKAKFIGLSDTGAIFLYVLFYLVFTIFSTPIGMLTDRVGRKPVLLLGYLLFSGICLLLVFASSHTTVGLTFLLYGACYAMIDAVQRTYVVDLAPAAIKATALGTFHTAVGLVALPGGFLAGLLWDIISPSATFIYGLALSLAAAAVLLLFVRKR